MDVCTGMHADVAIKNKYLVMQTFIHFFTVMCDMCSALCNFCKQTDIHNKFHQRDVLIWYRFIFDVCIGLIRVLDKCVRVHVRCFVLFSTSTVVLTYHCTYGL